MSEEFENEYDGVAGRIDLCEILQEHKGSAQFRFYCRIKLQCESDSPESSKAIGKILGGIKREFSRLGLPEITVVALTNRGNMNENATIHLAIGRAEDIEEVSHPFLYMIISNSLSGIAVEDLLLHELGNTLYVERTHGPEFLYS